MRRSRRSSLGRAALTLALLASAGCASAALRGIEEPAAGVPALRLVADPDEVPALVAAFEARDEGLLEALDRSLAWFDGPAARAAYPFAPLGVSLEHARRSAAAFRELLAASPDGRSFAAGVARDFDLWASTGDEGRGTVLFTGYYTPVFRASPVATETFRYPLYRRPPDLVTGDGVDRVLGRAVADQVAPYPARAEIEADPAALGLRGLELAWLGSDLERFLIHVQGGARLEFPDGAAPLDVAFAATNGRPYTAVGRLLVADGKIAKEKLSLPAIRAYFEEHPEELAGYLNRNERYVFFREAEPGTWPTGALNFPVTPLRTLATDKSLFPPGGVVLAATRLAGPEGGDRPFVQFLLDQDAGGAIRSPGRADIYVGAGAEAGEIAGHQAYRGRLYFLLLKPERLAPAPQTEEARAR